jgi:hypothetical protein
MTAKEKTFITISNEQIYEEIKKMNDINTQQHHDIIKRLDFTNGKVKMHNKVIWGIGGITLTVALFILNMLFTHVGG